MGALLLSEFVLVGGATAYAALPVTTKRGSRTAILGCLPILSYLIPCESASSALLALVAGGGTPEVVGSTLSLERALR